VNIHILKSVDVRLDGVLKALAAHTRLTLPDEKAQKLIDAGFAEQTDAAEEVRTLVQSFGDRWPGGNSGDWITKHIPEIWRSHMTAFLKGDLSAAKETYNAMLSAWQNRHNHQQPDLVAA
jgi:hypothetical protein